jgi:hypothetical protein
MAGLLFSDYVLGILNLTHSIYVGLAVFGITLGLFPTKKTEDPDTLFRNRMTRFGTIWISMTMFIFVLIFSYMESVLLSIILILSSFLILGAIIAIYVYRIEKKQKISIKWRLYLTTILIILIIVWGILIAIMYITEVV